MNHVYRHVHGLRFQASRHEKALLQSQVKPFIQNLYHGGVVAYKGGHLVKDLLQKLGIPSMDLEQFGCPKADQLFSSGFDAGPSCGFHQTSQNKHWIHCPKQEVYLFQQWLTEHV